MEIIELRFIESSPLYLINNGTDDAYRFSFEVNSDIYFPLTFTSFFENGYMNGKNWEPELMLNEFIPYYPENIETAKILRKWLALYNMIKISGQLPKNISLNAVSNMPKLEFYFPVGNGATMNGYPVTAGELGSDNRVMGIFAIGKK